MISVEMNIVRVFTWTMFVTNMALPTLGLEMFGLHMAFHIGFLVGCDTAHSALPQAFCSSSHVLGDHVFQI